MLAGTVYNNLISTLKNNPTLSEYVKNVFKGLRYDIDPTSFPCIMVEPVSNNEIIKDMNHVKDIRFSLDILAYTYNISDPEKGIVGDDNYKGILDIENDIKGCLQSSNTLGNTVIDIQFQPTVFSYKELPVRGMTIPVKILFRQTNNV